MIEIREAEPGDENVILKMIRELAVYEKEPNAVTNTEKELAVHLFEEKICSALVAIEKKEVIGFALFYTAYSTWKGKCIYLEDFYVKEDKRRSGVGTKLFQSVIDIATDSKAHRMEWQVYDWNQNAINFYKKHNAVLDNQWINGRFEFNYKIK